MNKILKNNLGFSIVEILVAATVIGIGSLVVMRSLDESSKQVKRIDQQIDFEQFIFGLDNYLGRQDVCDKNFLSPGLLVDRPIRQLIDPTTGANPEIVYQAGGSYLDGKINIQSMQFVKIDQATPALRVTFNRRNNSTDNTTYLYVRDIPMVHELNAAKTAIQTCYETTEAPVNLAEKLCDNNNGVYDLDTKICSFTGVQEGPCPDGKVLTKILLTSSTTSSPICKDAIVFNKCPNTWIKTIDSSGLVTCLSFSEIIHPTPAPITATTAATAQDCGLKIINNKISLSCSPGPLPQDCSGGPVDGVWSSIWYPVTDLSNCVQGEVKERKLCNNPAPSCGGTPCFGTRTHKWTSLDCPNPPPPPSGGACTDGQVQAGTLISDTPNTTYCGVPGETGNHRILKRQVCTSGNWVDSSGNCQHRTQNICTDPSKPRPPTSTNINCSSSGTEIIDSSYTPTMNGGTSTFHFSNFSCTGDC